MKGGLYNEGTIFSVNTDGSNYMVLHSFDVTNGSLPDNPMIIAGNRLYGMTPYGGTNGDGVFYSINVDGSNFTNLVNFGKGTDTPFFAYYHYEPVLLYDNGLIYGILGSDPTNNDTGCVFSINTNGSNFTVLHQFEVNTLATNGCGPSCLILVNNTLYGVTSRGIYGGQTVFSVGTNGMGFHTLYNFATNSFNPGDGYGLEAESIAYANGQLWGTTYGDTISSDNGVSGTIFSMNTNGSNFAFNYIANPTHNFSWSGIENPVAGLLNVNNFLYGVSYYGGSDGGGEIFAIDGTVGNSNLVDVYDFVGGAMGSTPDSIPVVTGNGNTIYGEALNSAASNYGEVYSLTFAPPILSIALVETNQVVLSWLTNYQNYTLQSTTNLVNPVWIDVTNEPVIVGNDFDVTDAVTYDWVTNFGTAGDGIINTNGPIPPGDTGTTNGMPSMSSSTYFRLYSSGN